MDKAPSTTNFNFKKLRGHTDLMILSVIIPVYHCKDSLVSLYERIVKTINKLNEFDRYEIIFIEDCGHDGSWEVINMLIRKDQNVRGIQFSRNFGQNQGISAGLKLCKGEWAVVMDCDLQDRPEGIADLWQMAQKGHDVINARRLDRQDSAWRKLTSRLFHVFLEWLSGLSIDPDGANFRMINRKVISAYLSMDENSRTFGAMVQWLGFPTSYVDIKHDKRYEGESSYSFRKLLGLAIEISISYSNRPLKISIVAGLFICFLSVIAFIVVMVRYVMGNDITGWTSIMISVWLLGGTIIANLGILGLYLGKTYDETRKRPGYVIAKKRNFDG